MPTHFLAATAPAFFAHFAEDVTYRDAQGLERVIQAVVARPPPSPTGETGEVLVEGLAIAVRNDPTLGIDPAALDTGKGSILVARRPGEVPDWRPVVQVTAQDEGVLLLHVL